MRQHRNARPSPGITIGRKCSRADAGKITPVEAQELLRAKYHTMYGNDPKMDGYFAYSVNLLRSAEAGKLPMTEAEALVSAREQELMAQRESNRPYPRFTGTDNNRPTHPTDATPNSSRRIRGACRASSGRLFSLRRSRRKPALSQLSAPGPIAGFARDLWRTSRASAA